MFFMCKKVYITSNARACSNAFYVIYTFLIFYSSESGFDLTASLNLSLST